MPEPPPDDRDLRLARHLDEGVEGGADPLYDALRAARPETSVVTDEERERLWTRIEGQTTRRPDRPPARAPTRLVRRPGLWAAAAVLVAIGAGVWTLRADRAPVVAEAQAVTWEAPDGSSFVLRPHTRLERVGERSYRLDGEAYVAVAPDPGRPFTVEAGPGTVRVLGTRFVVSTRGDDAEVFVEEGRVEVTADALQVVLGAGEGARLTADGVVADPGASAETALDWRRGEVVFEREAARHVAAEIGAHFGVPVAVAPELGRERVTGVIGLDGAESALADLARVLGSRAVPDGRGFRIER